MTRNCHLTVQQTRAKVGNGAIQKPAMNLLAGSEVTLLLPEAMTGRSSPAKAAVGDKPVFAYIASLPQPQRGIAEAIDALAAKTLPGLERSVKWGMAYYGVGDGWCFSSGGFAQHVRSSCSSTASHLIRCLP